MGAPLLKSLVTSESKSARSSFFLHLPCPTSCIERSTVADTELPSLTIPPGSAHSCVSLRRMASSCTWPVSGSRRVTIGSAAWLGPHCPSSPRPRSPVRPCGLSGAPRESKSTDVRSCTPSLLSIVYVVRALSSKRSGFGGSAQRPPVASSRPLASTSGAVNSVG